MFYILLDADKKGKFYEILFSDVAGTAYMQAVGYLTGYGVLIG
ncbi:hypothetical protein [Oscillibacter sp.]|nr:hypothetical protein [Oscillibacter sp.]